MDETLKEWRNDDAIPLTFRAVDCMHKKMEVLLLIFRNFIQNILYLSWKRCKGCDILWNIFVNYQHTLEIFEIVGNFSAAGDTLLFQAKSNYFIWLNLFHIIQKKQYALSIFSVFLRFCSLCGNLKQVQVLLYFETRIFETYIHFFV